MQWSPVNTDSEGGGGGGGSGVYKLAILSGLNLETR